MFRALFQLARSDKIDAIIQADEKIDCIFKPGDKSMTSSSQMIKSTLLSRQMKKTMFAKPDDKNFIVIMQTGEQKTM
jgi:hypothetical protein